MIGNNFYIILMITTLLNNPKQQRYEEKNPTIEPAANGSRKEPGHSAIYCVYYYYGY
jgi:hypothetical protein